MHGQNDEFTRQRDECICCDSILSLVQFYFPLFWGMVMYDNEFKIMGNKN